MENIGYRIAKPGRSNNFLQSGSNNCDRISAWIEGDEAEG